MSTLTYTRYELVRVRRNIRFTVFSLVVPVVLLLFFGSSFRNGVLDGVPYVLYYMTGMIAFGTMAATLSLGGMIAGERRAGWIRQIRITPLSILTYLGTKVLTSYLMALISIALLSIVGAALGVSLSAGAWATMIGLVLVGLVPFALMGVLLGHLLTVESTGPALGGLITFFALFGGAYYPLATHGFFLQVIKLIPSYWIVQAGKTALGGKAWPLEGWIVLAVWSVVLVRLIRIVFVRDSGRA